MIAAYAGEKSEIVSYCHLGKSRDLAQLRVVTQKEGNCVIDKTARGDDKKGS